MKTVHLVVLGVAVIFIGVVAYTVMGQKTEEAMMEKSDAAMEEQMESTATMENEDSEMMDAETMTEESSMMTTEDDATMMTHAGSYEAYSADKLANAEEGDVVLFFRAAWCPTCRALDADIRAHADAIPADLTILDVNYDTSTALKQQYGVTYQHTLVQVDQEGNMIAKWSGSPTLAALSAEVK